MRLPALLLLALAAGCAPLDTRYAPVRVIIDVRDAVTGEPLEDVAVLGGVNAMFNPDHQPSMLGRPGEIPSFVVVNEPSSWILTTNGSGQATGWVAGGNPTSMLIIKDGYMPTRAFIETNSTRPVGLEYWNEGLVDPIPAGTTPTANRLEFRVLADEGSGS